MKPTDVNKQCDIILPVYNGLTYVKECIDSVLKYTTEVDYKLWIINDNSDQTTTEYLRDIAQYSARIELLENNINLGFVVSCNNTVAKGNAEYIVILNSDVIVTPQWLSKMIACAESDARIATVNPFTNQASNINIRIAPGANFFGMNEILNHSNPNYPDIVTGVGFCMLIKRSIIDQFGLFDEIYGMGYCEESDFCMRLTTNGYRTVIADNVYVYHKGRASFSDRNERYYKNRKIFDQKWGAEYKKQFKAFLTKNPLKEKRDLFKTPQKWEPTISMRQTYRKMRKRYQNHDIPGVIKEAVKGILDLPKSTRQIVTPEYAELFARKNALKVTYVLPNVSIAGGVLSVIQLVNELILLGIEARIVALRLYPEIYNWKLYTEPIIYKNEAELIDNFPPSDIVVATHWTTAGWVKEVVNRGVAKKAVYFIQDYEAWFYPEEDKESRNKVIATYELIENKIVKSDWLQSLLLKDGHKSKKIHLGMDLSIFYPREAKKHGNVVLAMARPRTPRRGFNSVIKALQILKERMENVQIILFGDDLSKYQIPFEFQDKGVITDQNLLAQLYSQADVFLDGSDFQGFGRPALEAMACGTACVLTNVGGVTEYAINEVNCLTVPPRNPVLFAEAIIKILTNFDLKKRLIEGGFQTARRFCHKKEAKETLKYFESILNKGTDNVE
jgi:GT2 family glycosyltransferase/glycosyltransferase involved in cell wall biosynthesis